MFEDERLQDGGVALAEPPGLPVMVDPWLVGDRVEDPGRQPPDATARLVARVVGQPPGPVTVAALSVLPPLERLPAFEQVSVLRAWQAQASWVAAQQATAVAAVAAPGAAPTAAVGEDVDLQEMSARAEVAAALRLSAAAAEQEVHVARALTGRLSATGAALAAGRITYRHAQAIVDAVEPLPDDAARTVEQQVLGHAATQTVAALRRSLRRAVLAADPRQAQERHERARTERGVWLQPDDDGMTVLSARLPAAEAEACWTALTARALAVNGGRPDPDGRTLDQLRADVLSDLLRRILDEADLPAQQRRRPHIQVTIDLPTLLGLAQNPAELAGYGPITPDVARGLAADGQWRRLVTDPVTGTLLHYGRTTYRPPTPLADHVLARDRTCRGLGCSRPARTCEIDHVLAWDDDGPTDHDNLVPLSKRCHRRKTAGWHLDLAADSTAWWTTPTGHTYPDPPDAVGTPRPTPGPDDAPPF